MSAQLHLFSADASPSITRARRRIMERIDEGVDCPCCGQLCKMYRRQINAPMAQLLIWLVRLWDAVPRWYAVREMPLIQGRRGGGDYAKLRWWGLIEERAKGDIDGEGRTSGYWRPTVEGCVFAHGWDSVERYALIYDNRLAGFEGPRVGIRQCLGERFSFGALWLGHRHDAGGELRCDAGHPLDEDEINGGTCRTCEEEG